MITIIITVLLIIILLNSKVSKFITDPIYPFKQNTINRNILLCGNSPEFTVNYQKYMTNVANPFIIRFNTVLDHLPDSDKTDALVIAPVVLKNTTDEKYALWKKRTQGIYFIDDFYNNNKIFDNIKQNNPDVLFTSGFTVLCYLLNYTNKITLIGFNLPNDYHTNSNWFSNDSPIWGGHNIDIEKQNLARLIKDYNINIV